MINERQKVDQRGGHRIRTYLFPDDRRGLGYGQVHPTGFNAHRISPSQYPYTDPDEHIDDDEMVFDDDEMDRFIKKTNMGYKAVDSLNKKSADPFYFVAGNTTGLGGVSGVSETTMQVARNSMVPFPGWSKKVQAVSGGYTTKPAFNELPPLRTGTKQGYSTSPPQPVDDPYEINAYRLQDILDDEELAVLLPRIVRRLLQHSTIKQD